jgi:hypothetical protein
MTTITCQEYQIAIRQHLEIFEAKQEDVKSMPRPEDTGLPRPSRHSMPSLCKPEAALKGRGAVYYSRNHGIYQAAQNMARSHLSEWCPQIHPGMKQRVRRLAAPSRNLQVG